MLAWKLIYFKEVKSQPDGFCFRTSDPGGVHAATGAPPRGADRQLPSVQREDADRLLQVHPQGVGGHGLQRTRAVELHQLRGYVDDEHDVVIHAASLKHFHNLCVFFSAPGLDSRLFETHRGL